MLIEKHCTDCANLCRKRLGISQVFPVFSNKALIGDRPIAVQFFGSRHLFLRIGVTRADLKHCGKMPDAREELNRSVREGIIESRHSINSLDGMGSRLHDLGAELRMHSFTVNCVTFSNEEKVAVVVPVTSVEVTCSEAMLALSFSTLLVKCLIKRLGRAALG